jgi:hypothetical protein
MPVILLRPQARPTSSARALHLRARRRSGAVETMLAAALAARGSTPWPWCRKIRGGMVRSSCRGRDRAAAELRGAETGERPKGALGVVLGGSCARAIARTWAGPKVRFAASFEATLARAALAAEGERGEPGGALPRSTRRRLPRRWQHLDADHASPPGWWAALGHDAAVLAWAAVRTLPQQGTEDPREVTARLAKAAQALGDASGELWTSEARGFGGKQVLPRTIGARELR